MGKPTQFELGGDANAGAAFQALLETANAPLFVIDVTSRRVVASNAGAAREVRRPLEQLIGASIDEVFTASSTRPRPEGAAAARALEREDFPTLIGQSAGIRDVCRRIGAVAKSDVTVLIQGQSGTGKEVVAEVVHAHSRRSRGPLVKVNCAALAESLIESELFGHVKGAFTGAFRDRQGRFRQASGGTILLDEIGSMSLAAQAKLLRVLQEQEFEPVGSSSTVAIDARVIAATNTDLANAVAAGRFRADLYYRLNVFPLHLPALRERKEDIPLLAQHFLQLHAGRQGRSVQSLAPQTLQFLSVHDWPGNVRELENAIEHAIVIEESSAVQPSSLPLLVAERGVETQCSHELRLRERLHAFEKQALLDALARANGVKKHAAALLGVDARNLPYLLHKHQLLGPDSSAAE
jgi:transcriptional regulator with PAS, ATPase and Fis domain